MYQADFVFDTCPFLRGKKSELKCGSSYFFSSDFFLKEKESIAANYHFNYCWRRRRRRRRRNRNPVP
jgi:hypothetical protein